MLTPKTYRHQRHDSLKIAAWLSPLTMGAARDSRTGREVRRSTTIILTSGRRECAKVPALALLVTATAASPRISFTIEAPH